MSTTVPPFVYAGEYRGERGPQGPQGDPGVGFPGPQGDPGLPGPGSAAWTALQVVAVGSVREAPDGSWIKSTAARTTRSTFDTTEAGFWQSTIVTSTTDQAALSARFGAQTIVPTAYPTAFVANGEGNSVAGVSERDFLPQDGHVEGNTTKVYNKHGHAEGVASTADGQISHAEGNTTICTANDSHVEGNRGVAGRLYFETGVTWGSEDAGDSLGVLEFALIPDTVANPEGDCTSLFPNLLTDNVVGRYGIGAVMDARGNIYPPTTNGVFVPAVWGADPLVPTTANDLKWAMHSICMLRGGPAETAIGFFRIAKATYTAGVGTKVYYVGHHPGANGLGIYSSYSAVVPVARYGGGGNGMHTEGFKSSSWGYGSHAEGFYTRAWGNAAHSEGRETQALNAWTHAEGYQTKALGIASRATGWQAVATRDYERAYASGARVVAGDHQITEMLYGKSHDSAVGWGTVPILKNLADGVYAFDATVIGLQTAGSGGTVGNAFTYKFSGAVSVVTVSSVPQMRVLGAITRELVGRTAAVNDAQSVSVTGSPTGGTFTLTPSGFSATAAIAYNAAATAVQTALEGSVGSGNVGVTGVAGGPYRVVFRGTLAGAVQAVMASSGAGLTGGTSPGITTAKIRNGAATTMTGDGLSSGDRLSVENDLYTAGGARDLIVRLDQAGVTTYYTSTRSTVQQLLA